MVDDSDIAGHGHDFVIEYSACKEKLVKEEITFTDAAEPSRELTLILHARILGNQLHLIYRL